MDYSQQLNDLRCPMWLSSHLTQVFVTTPKAPYWTGTGGDVIYGDCEGDVFVSMAVEGVIPSKDGVKLQFVRGIEAWRRNGERLWYLPGHNGNSMCYSPIKDTILTFETGPDRIEEIEAKTGKVLREINKTELGTIGGGLHYNYGGSRVCYDVADQDKFWYADIDHHVVLQTDFSGKVYVQIGEYDVPGNDEAHLNSPKTVSNTNTWGRLLIGDTGNHRVTEYSVAYNFTKSFPFPEPYASYTVANQVALYTGGNPYSYYGVFILSDHLTPRPVEYLPFATDSFVVNPQDPTRVAIRWDDGLSREVSIGSGNCIAPPTTCQLFGKQHFIPKFGEAISPPIIDFYRPKKSIMISSTGKGKLLYEVADFNSNRNNRMHAKWSGQWSVIDTQTIFAGKMIRIKDDFPCTACRVRIIADEDTYIDGWTCLSN